MEAEALRTTNHWARFMQLTNDARMRNRGLSGGAGARRPGGVRQTQRPVAAAEKPAAQPRAAADGRTYATAPPAARIRIIGSRFDAYA